MKTDKGIITNACNRNIFFLTFLNFLKDVAYKIYVKQQYLACKIQHLRKLSNARFIWHYFSPFVNTYYEKS